MGFRGSNEFTKGLDRIHDIVIKVEDKQDKALDRLFDKSFRSINAQAKIIKATDGTLTDKRPLIQPLMTEGLMLIEDYNELLLTSMKQEAELGIKNNEFILTKYQNRLAGVGVIVGLTDRLENIPEQALTWTIGSSDFPDGLKLSNRIWILKRRTRQEIERIITDTIISGEAASSSLMTTRLEKLLKPGRAAVRTRLHGRNVSFDAARLLRTERTLAFRHADSMAATQNTGLIGIKWNIVKDDRTTVICKNLNSQDIWNLGAGVYKKGSEPYNPHIQCRSWPTEVSVSSKQFVDSWLKGDKTPGKTIVDENAFSAPRNVTETVVTASGRPNIIAPAQA